MSLKVTKKAESGLSGSLDAMNKDDKLKTLKIQFKLAKSAMPNYDEYRKELEDYTVELPQTFDMPDLSKMHKLYSIIQSFFSRVGTIESLAINNLSLFQSVFNLMRGYIQDVEATTLVNIDRELYPNAALQSAYVRSEMIKHYSNLRKVENHVVMATSFMKEVQIKKKELDKAMVNLTRQVKVMKSENSNY